MEAARPFPLSVTSHIASFVNCDLVKTCENLKIKVNVKRLMFSA